MRVAPSKRLPQEWEDRLDSRSLVAPPRCHLSSCLVELAPARKGRPPKFCSRAHAKIAERNPELRIPDDEVVDWWGPGEEEWTGLMSEHPWDDPPAYGFGYGLQGRDLPPFNEPVKSRSRSDAPEHPAEIIGQHDRPAGWDQK